VHLSYADQCCGELQSKLSLLSFADKATLENFLSEKKKPEALGSGRIRRKR
jgi:hypothetical protein